MLHDACFSWYADSDTTTLSRDEKIAILKELHAKLTELQGLVGPAAENFQPGGPHADPQSAAAGPSTSADQENTAARANPTAMAIEARTFKSAPKRKVIGGAKPAKGRSKPLVVDDDEEEPDAQAAARDSSDEEMADVDAAVAVADVAELMAMGFTAKQAKDALEDADGNVEAAANWLVGNCL
jgi:hypothetical protein